MAIANVTFRYYYDPVIRWNNGRLNEFWIRLLGSVFTFTFVYIWHGTREYIFIWTVFNFAGIVLEASARAVGSWPPYSRLERRLLGPRGRRRLYSALGSPLFTMSILSNFFFFMGADAGWLFFRRAWMSWPLGTPVLLVVMYCAAQTSFEVKNWEIRAKLNQQKKA